MAPSLTEVQRGRSAPTALRGPNAQGPVAVLFVPTAAKDRAAVKDRLARTGAVVTVAADVTESVELLGMHRYGLVVLDLAAERSGLATVRLLRTQFPQVPVLGLVDPSRPLVAGEAIPAGVAGLLSWPFDEREFEEAVSDILDRFSEHQSGPADAEAVVAQSSAMRDVVAAARVAAASPSTGVGLCGESGSGRALVARLIHRLSAGGRTDRPFVHVDCLSERPEELELRLFGTAADRRQEQMRGPAGERISSSSALAQAMGGTLYLTNLAEAPARVQAKLARLLRDREAQMEGRRDAVDLDARPVASFGPDVEGTLAEGRLRQDLFDRIVQARVNVPPLRQRREDLPALSAQMLAQACEHQATPRKSFSRAALALLMALPWRGNGRELEQLVNLLVRSNSRAVIQLDDVLEHAALDGAAPRTDVGLSLREARAKFERECISATLIRHHGRVGEAAKALGLQRTNLYRKVRQLKVPRALLSARR